MRMIWGTREPWPVSAETIAAAAAAGATEIVELPCQALPDLAEGYNEIDTTPPVPSVVSMRQARLALLQQGMLATVTGAVAQMDEETQIYWDYSTEVHRRNEVLIGVAAGLNLSDGDLDNLFRLAATL